MEITVGIFVLVVTLAFICEFIDSAMGMGYGTILAPTLIIYGFEPLAIVPAVLISQAFGGFIASIFHHQLKNCSFSHDSKDLKIVFIISAFGIVSSIFGVMISINISKIILKTYIGILVIAMGIIMLRKNQFKFSWKKIIFLGILSAFNKGISGGGFGPIVTSGQIISGQETKNAIGATTLAEVPICIVSFLAYIIGRTFLEIKENVWSMPLANFFKKMFSAEMLQWELVLGLIIGSVLVAPFGAFTTKIIKKEKLNKLLGIFIIIIGTTTILKTYF